MGLSRPVMGLLYLLPEYALQIALSHVVGIYLLKISQICLKSVLVLTIRWKVNLSARVTWRLAKLQKAAISFVIYTCPSAWNIWAPTRLIFTKFDIWVFFPKSVEKIRVSLKSIKKDSTLYEGVWTFMTIACSFLRRMRNVSCKGYGENPSTYFVFNNCFFFNSYRSWEKVENTSQRWQYNTVHAHCMLDN